MNTKNKLQEPREIIEAAFEKRTVITPENAGKELLAAIESSIVRTGAGHIESR